MGPTDPAATRPSRYWFCSVGHSLRPTGAARCREHRGRPWKASLRAPFRSRSPKPEFAARIPSTPHLGSTHPFKRFGVLARGELLFRREFSFRVENLDRAKLPQAIRNFARVASDHNRCLLSPVVSSGRYLEHWNRQRRDLLAQLVKVT